ncbi:MAG: sensor histidine kinase, partial [Spirochaetales bacterium]|nr:sensor histidine kinase [Spirochaetales bacterium]
EFTTLELDIETSFLKINELFKYNSTIKKDVVSIYLFSLNGSKLVGPDLNQNISTPISKHPWFMDARDDPSISHFSSPHTSNYSLSGDEDVIFLSRSVDYIKNGFHLKGILLIELNFKNITDLAEKTNLGDGGHILILDDKDSLVYFSGNRITAPFPESMVVAIKNYIGDLKTQINKTEYFISINTLIHTRWRIVTVSNVNDIAEAKNDMIILLTIILLVSFILTTLISIYISKRITSPINKLKDSMFRLENGDFNTKVIVKGQKEVVRLSMSFNTMIDKIRDLMDKVVTEQRETRKNELRALQNQINPHFLYNTLDSIVWLAENHRSEDVITTVVALAKFFRLSISKGATTITVAEEISHIESYLTIQKIRYINKFVYNIEIDQDVKTLEVMKLILQPIVENAIYHGIGDDMEYIGIKAYKDNNFLYFEVENSGYGISEEKIEEIYELLRGNAEQTSVGLKNVYQRIKLFYGDEADIEILSELDEKTTIKIIIPLSEKTEGSL